MRVDLFDFDLPEDRIALRPASPRDSARLLRVNPQGELSDHTVRNLVGFLRPGDALVFNDTRVIPAQLEGTRHRQTPDGEAVSDISATLHMRVADDCWKAFVRPAKRIRAGDRFSFGKDNEACFDGTLTGVIESRGEGGEATLKFDFSGPELDRAIAAEGHVPLPPYIASKRPEDGRDLADYQTVYARHDGAVAAPTAGLHFTEDLLEELERHGVERHFVTLHVGAGTFLPVKADDTENHVMHAEIGEVSDSVAEALNAVRRRGGRIVSVGTTSLRLLETAAGEDGVLRPWRGATDIFITPGYQFRCVDMLMTNFHLPRSTLFMLVSAFSGRDTMLAAYRHAIDNGYRFYSYGDSSLLSRAEQDHD
ncbi:tRNA preQ1(34) S-adenosylmethionine ribosyltransferase-isomerase QueA [Hoeflea sp. WL0058]|uniref:S-adenosylmethionine:tRNA ribosyltransferase-isomerase n=1 Tax=Flavimaribacter sediminis TaxID=2865987 RepID=A0AAE2ZSZ2_9HYPH|nr:tRNA preQ1(34) S-adenosylmethionine ribosyltransferase-isomerase QueA [Flavimaribacter sediminis]MBW8640422.1 tRNA preQ1(34) S-adenosylmethionine ribosyltransferase-isomerase QueA [Flavimaribacter sediminis]